MTSDSLLGQTVGNYVVVGFLGEGGMAQVYVAEHPQIRRRVAIKILNAQAADRFVTEARAVTRVEPPEHHRYLRLRQDGRRPALLRDGAPPGAGAHLYTPPVP